MELHSTLLRVRNLVDAVRYVFALYISLVSRIIMDGGTRDVEWREQDNHVYLTGPAEFVYEGEIEINSK